MRTRLRRSVYASSSEAGQPVGTRRGRDRRGMLGLLVFCALGLRALAGDVQILVRDQAGRPIEGAIVWAEVAREKPPPPVQTEIVQKNRQFIPPVIVIPVGSVVRFPNWDNVQHHVYSFSSAKTFDIPLYIGESPRAIEFERPGIVTLGCNIHDWMAAYIVVLDTSVSAKTDATGRALLRNLPPGPVSVFGWSPQLRGAPVKTDVSAGQGSAELSLKLRPAFRRTPPDDRGGYR
ncbi:MAG TPA: methylamine utilization protein [Terrimicrobiaceae bacterium]